MSRIESEELSIMDIEWYGVDRKGKIAVFCSAGVANVPEFVCADKERQERLIALFEKLPILSGVSFCFVCADVACQAKRKKVTRKIQKTALIYPIYGNQSGFSYVI